MSHSILVVILIACAVGVVAGAEPPQAPPPHVPVDEVVKRLPRGQKFAEQGKIDLFVAATAVWDLKADDDRLWEPAVDLGRRLFEKAGITGDRKPVGCPSSYRDYATYLRRMPPHFKRLDELYTQPDPRKANPPILWYQEAIQAHGVVGSTGITNNLIISRGSVQSEKGIQKTVMFVNGDVTAQGSILSSIIVCDGDLTVKRVAVSLVVARGNITVHDGAEAGTMVAGGKITLGAQGKVVPEHFNVIKENEPNPFSYITFFELSRVGLQVKVAEGAVLMSAVAAGKESDKAGLKVGDTVLEVNGKKPTDAESLRRLLRDTLAVGDATVKVKRGDKIETVKLSLPD